MLFSVDGFFVVIGILPRKENVYHPDKQSSPTAEAQPTSGTGQRQYVPPEAEVIKQFARDVCQVLVERGHQTFGKQEVIWSMANFLTLIAELTAKRFNATPSRPV
jgi:hypothetical protein